MRTVVFLIISASLACGQDTTPRDSNYVPGEDSSPVAAYRHLYLMTAQLTSSPGWGYQPPKVDDWPVVTTAQRMWAATMARNGATLSRKLRAQLVPNAAHCNNAIGDMERGWRIHITQKNWFAQQKVQKLYAAGRAEFAKCTVVRPDSNSAPETRSDAGEPVPPSTPPPPARSDAGEPVPPSAAPQSTTNAAPVN